MSTQTLSAPLPGFSLAAWAERVKMYPFGEAAPESVREEVIKGEALPTPEEFVALCPAFGNGGDAYTPGGLWNRLIAASERIRKASKA